MGNTLATITIRTNSETKEFYKSLFDGSGANSQGEFLQRMCEKFNSPEKTIEPEIRTLTVEKTLQPNELLLSLTPAQMYALRETVLSADNFAQEQNEIIDSLKEGNKPFMYFGSLFEPEFQSIWVRNIILTKAMTAEQKENAIRHNMAAFLVNKFLLSLIDGKISCSRVSAFALRTFINKQIEAAKPKPAPIENPPLQKPMP